MACCELLVVRDDSTDVLLCLQGTLPVCKHFVYCLCNPAKHMSKYVSDNYYDVDVKRKVVSKGLFGKTTCLIVLIGIAVIQRLIYR